MTNVSSDTLTQSRWRHFGKPLNLIFVALYACAVALFVYSLAVSASERWLDTSLPSLVLLLAVGFLLWAAVRAHFRAKQATLPSIPIVVAHTIGVLGVVLTVSLVFVFHSPVAQDFGTVVIGLFFGLLGLYLLIDAHERFDKLP